MKKSMLYKISDIQKLARRLLKGLPEVDNDSRTLINRKGREMYYQTYYPTRYLRNKVEDEPYQEVSVRPPVDVEEFSDRYEISLEMPGIPRENINAEMENGLLIIRGERQNQELPEGAKRIWRERSQHNLLRSFRLGRQVDSESIRAELNQGVLKVTIAKSESEVKRTIEIQG